MVYRELRLSECDLLKSFLYVAIFIPEGVTPPEQPIIVTEVNRKSCFYVK